MIEKEIVVGTGPLETQEKRNYAESYILRIHEDIHDIKKAYIRLGFHLHEIEYCGYYKYFGYDDFYEFCGDNYKMSRSAISRCINVWVRFADYDAVSHVRKMWIKEKYADYSYSQLCEMVSMDNPDEIKSDMTIQQIRNIKRDIAANRRKNNSCATSQKKEVIEPDAALAVEICDVAQNETGIAQELIDFPRLLNIESRVSNAFITLGIEFDEQVIIFTDSDKIDAMDTLYDDIFDDIFVDKNFDAAYIHTLNLLVYLAMCKAR